MDLKAAERDGWEIPWPISYADIVALLRPGRAAHRRVRRHRRLRRAAGQQVPAAAARRRAAASGCCEKGMHKVGIPVVAGRRANMTRPTRGFPACHYCGNCGAGCDTASFFCSADHLLPFAMQTGQPRDSLERRRRAHPDRTTTASRTASSISIDRPAQSSRRSRKVVVVGASCVDSTRILLNSKSERYPNGLGNGSDVIGRYLCEQIRLNVTGYLPVLVGTPTRNDRGIGGEHIYMPRFNHRARTRAATTCAASARSSGTRARASTARTRGSERDSRLRRLAQERRSSGGIRPGSRSIRSARSCRTRTTASPWIRRASTATACRCRGSTTGSARTSGR